MIKQPFGTIASFAGAEIMFSFLVRTFQSGNQVWQLDKKQVLLFLSVIIKLMEEAKALPKY